MKELSIEEKARRYDEALEKAKQFSEKPYLEDSAGIVEYIFPELAESEDEKVRKGILELVRQSSEVLDKQNQNNMIAWLEKQGEQPKDVTYTHEVKTGNGNIKALVTEKVQLPKKFEKQGEQKPNPVLDIEIPFGAKDSELQEASYYIPEGFHAEIEGNRVIIKRGEQKPAEWSEEDEKVLHAIRNALNYEKPRNYLKSRDFEFTDILDWLKSLKDRVQPKQEWSEEDIEMLNSAISFVEHSAFTTIGKGKNNVIAWLKSLKDKYTWKPSDEQMKQLGWVAEQNKDNMIGKELMTLYNDLKKL